MLGRFAQHRGIEPGGKAIAKNIAMGGEQRDHSWNSLAWMAASDAP